MQAVDLFFLPHMEDLRFIASINGKKGIYI
jgi:hypothetical protein